MSKGVYVGVPTQFPIKDTSTTNYTLSLANIDKFFTVQTGTTSSTQWTRSDVSGGGLKLVPGNIGVNSSTATITLTAKRDLTGVVISGAYYTESNYDKITLTVSGTTVLSAVSGTSAAAQRWSGSLSSGASIVLTYAKDSSQHASSESNTYIQVSCNSVTEVVETITGYETRPAARNVFAMYTGVNNISRAITKGYIGAGNFELRDGIPTGYQQVEYINSSDNYFDTGLTMNYSGDSWEYILDADLTNNDTWGGGNGYFQFQANIFGGKRGTLRMVYDGTAHTTTYYLNGATLKVEDWAGRYEQNTVKIGIMAMGNSNNTWYDEESVQTGKIYFCQIKKNGSLVRDFIPAGMSNGMGTGVLSTDAILYDVLGREEYHGSGMTIISPGPTYREVAKLFFDGAPDVYTMLYSDAV